MSIPPPDSRVQVAPVESYIGSADQSPIYGGVWIDVLIVLVVGPAFFFITTSVVSMVLQFVAGPGAVEDFVYPVSYVVLIAAGILLSWSNPLSSGPLENGLQWLPVFLVPVIAIGVLYIFYRDTMSADTAITAVLLLEGLISVSFFSFRLVSYVRAKLIIRRREKALAISNSIEN